jgi:hypothetical protein
MQRTHRILISFAVVLCLAWGAVAEIVVSPLTIEIPANPGDEAAGSFVVRNAGTTVENVTVSAFGYTLDSAGAVLLDPVARSLVPYLTFSPVTFSVQPGEESEVKFGFTAPPEAGDHWAIFFVEGSTIVPVSASSGDVQTSVGVKVQYGVKLIQRDPVAIRDGAIVGMSLVAGDVLSVGVSFANLGNSVLRKASGWVEFRGVAGVAVSRVALDEFTTLPGGFRDLAVTIPGEVLSVPGAYLALCVVDFGGDQLVAGELQFAVE